MALLDKIGRILSNGKYIATHTLFSCVHSDSNTDRTVEDIDNDLEDCKGTELSEVRVSMSKSSALFRFIKKNLSQVEATLGFADTSYGGLMSVTDKEKLDGIEAGAQKNVTIPVATTSENGLMSASDKEKLNGIESVKRTNIGHVVGQKYDQGDVYTWGDNSILTHVIRQTSSTKFQMFIHFAYDKVYALYTSANGAPWTCQKAYNESDTSDEAEAIKAIFHDNLASQSLAGLMSPLDKGNLDNSIVGDEVSADHENKKVVISYRTHDGSHYSTPIESATSEKAGVMTAADKAKLDALEEAVELPTTSGISFRKSTFYTIGGKLVNDIAYYEETIIVHGSIRVNYCMAAYLDGKYYKYLQGPSMTGEINYTYSATYTEDDVPSNISSLFRATDTQSGLMSFSDKSSLDSVGSLFAEDMLLRTEGLVFSNVSLDDELEFTAHLKKGECFLIQTSKAGSISINADGGHYEDDQTIEADGGSENTSPAEHSEYCLFQFGFTPLMRGETTNLTIKIVKFNN